MLSYQHIYHAGNLADVHKHIVLCLLLSQMREAKQKPMTYMETHAGRGLYLLKSKEAQKNKEYEAGIEFIIKERKLPVEHFYVNKVQTLRQKWGGLIYPGSPLFAQSILSEADAIQLMELHPIEFGYLKKIFQSASNCHIHHREGYEGVLAVSPPKFRRGVVFIDPSYEIKKEYQTVLNFIKKLHKKWPEAVKVLWYPLLENAYYVQLREAFRDLTSKNTVVIETKFRQAGVSKGLYGSGMGLLNCPYGLESALKQEVLFLEGIEKP